MAMGNTGTPSCRFALVVLSCGFPGRVVIHLGDRLIAGQREIGGVCFECVASKERV